MICHKVFEILEDSPSSVKYMELSMETIMPSCARPWVIAGA